MMLDRVINSLMNTAKTGTLGKAIVIGAGCGLTVGVVLLTLGSTFITLNPFAWVETPVDRTLSTLFLFVPSFLGAWVCGTEGRDI